MSRKQKLAVRDLEIMNMINEGISFNDIGRIYDMSPQNVNYIKQREIKKALASLSDKGVKI